MGGIMIELIDAEENVKFMATVISGIKYGNELYLLYAIERDNESDNLFISKLIKNSEGYVIDNNFSVDERDALDDVVLSILNKDPVDKLREKGISFVRDVYLYDINRFSVTKCYVTTYKKSLINDCISNYNLFVNKKKTAVVVREKDVSYFSKSNRPTIYLILFGLLVLIVGIVLIF